MKVEAIAVDPLGRVYIVGGTWSKICRQQMELNNAKIMEKKMVSYHI